MIASTTLFSLFFLPLLSTKNVILQVYGEEFEEDFAASTLDNSSNLTDAIGDDAGAESVAHQKTT